MSKILYLMMFAGGSIGSYVPVLLGQSILSIASILGGGVGAIVGLWLGFKLSS